jgi:hypothetical protein
MTNIMLGMHENPEHPSDEEHEGAYYVVAWDADYYSLLWYWWYLNDLGSPGPFYGPWLGPFNDCNDMVDDIMGPVGRDPEAPEVGRNKDRGWMSDLGDWLTRWHTRLTWGH